MNIALFRRLTRLEHTLFGLPFIICGALLPFITHTTLLHFEIRWLWILPAFMAARFSGMAFNQVIDRHIDKKNPRTQERVVASGKLASKTAYIIAILFLLLFLLFCSQINLATFCCSLIAAPLLFFYSYTKRITCLCHLVLGSIHFLGSCMAWVAVTGTLTLYPLLLATINMTHIVGMDIIYAFQDVKFDQKEAIHSIPVQLGLKGAQIVAQLFHLACICLLVVLGVICNFTFLYYLAPLITLITFLFLHYKVHKELREDDQLNNESIFFYCTVIIPFSTLTFILLQI
jgi:4-hydroxybenzoate polyprenyltransferase